MCSGTSINALAATQGCDAGCGSCSGNQITVAYTNLLDNIPFSECRSSQQTVNEASVGLQSQRVSGFSTTSGDFAAANGYFCNPPSPSPPPSAPPEPASDPCFPSSSMVTTLRASDGSRTAATRLDGLREGDVIVAATADRTLTTDTVSLFSIAKLEAHDVPFVVLTTSTNHSLTLTGSHHLPVGASCCSTLKKANDVTVGETVWVVSSGAAVATAVASKALTKAAGLHSPVLTNGGFPVVNGVVTSFDSIEKVTLAKHGLAPLLAACKATGTCERFRSLFLGDYKKYL